MISDDFDFDQEHIGMPNRLVDFRLPIYQRVRLRVRLRVRQPVKPDFRQ